MSSMLLRADQVGGQRVAEQVGDGHLRLAVLHGPPHVVERVAGQHAHQDGAGRFAAARARRRTGSLRRAAKVSSGSSTKLE